MNKRWLVAIGAALVLAASLFLALRPQNPMRIPKLLQTDYREAVCVIGGQPRSVESSGCGATCAAIVGQYVSRRGGPGPEALFRWAYDQGYYFGDGLGHEALIAMLGEFGLKGEWVKNDSGRILEQLARGRPVIAHMGRGMFANGSGHYVVLYGVTDQGLIWVHDPYKPERGQEPFEMAVLRREAKTGSSFLVVGQG